MPQIDLAAWYTSRPEGDPRPSQAKPSSGGCQAKAPPAPPPILAPEAVVHLSDGPRRVVALRGKIEQEGRFWWLIARATSQGIQPGDDLCVAELSDPEQGCTGAGYLGLSCNCLEYTDADGSRPCSHLRELVALGLLRPAPTWDAAVIVDEPVPDPVAPLIDEPAPPGAQGRLPFDAVGDDAEARRRGPYRSDSGRDRRRR